MTKESAKDDEAVGATENAQPINPLPGGQMLPLILARRGAAGFWLAVVLTGAGTGLAAAALTGLLEARYREKRLDTGTPIQVPANPIDR